MITRDDRSATELVDRIFLRSVPEPNSGCWLWEGATNARGHGQIRDGYALVYVHRVVLEWKLGRKLQPWPSECACHACDNGACVNPDHLWVGSQADNLRDMVSKGRSRRGERNLNSKLSVPDVVDIRRRHSLGDTIYRIAKDYGVAQRTISLVVRGLSWSHVDNIGR